MLRGECVVFFTQQRFLTSGAPALAGNAWLLWIVPKTVAFVMQEPPQQATSNGSGGSGISPSVDVKIREQTTSYQQPQRTGGCASNLCCNLLLLARSIACSFLCRNLAASAKESHEGCSLPPRRSLASAICAHYLSLQFLGNCLWVIVSRLQSRAPIIAWAQASEGGHGSSSREPCSSPSSARLG